MLKSAGRFILYVIKFPFPKQFKSISDLVSLLTGRGLIINDIPKAEKYLVNIGYFRLSAYFFPLLKLPKTDHLYKAGSTFEQVLNLYQFDKKLRLLIFNEIEKIEIAIRSIMVNIACQYFNDAFWITQSQYFYNQDYFNSSITEIDSELNKSEEDFIEHSKTN